MVPGTPRFCAILPLSLGVVALLIVGCRSGAVAADVAPPGGESAAPTAENGGASRVPAGDGADVNAAVNPADTADTVANVPANATRTAERGSPASANGTPGASAFPASNAPVNVGNRSSGPMGTPSMGTPQPRALPDSVVASARPATPVPTVPLKSSEEVKLLGVCSYTENAVTCWGPSGTRSKDLEPTVDGLLRTNSGYQGRMRYGYKNRVVVFSRPDGRTSVNYRSVDSSEGNYLETQSTNESFGPKIDAVYVSTNLGVDKGSIVARVQHYDARPATGELPLKAGAQVAVDGIKVRIVGVARMTPSDPYYNSGFNMGRDQPRWKVEMTTDRTANPEAYSGFQIVGTDGRPIEMIDEKGQPLDRMRATGGQRSFPVTMPIGSNRSGGSDLVLMVNPTLVKRLRFSVTRPEVGQFRDIPLDPKR